MILAYDDLLRVLREGQVRFTPDITPDQIGLSSIDLRLGWVFTRLLPKEGFIVQPARGFDPTDVVQHQDFSQVEILGEHPTFRLPPGEFRLAFTLEEIALPHGLAASVQGKSSLARAGLAIHTTAPHIHPGFNGHITLELYNHGPWQLDFVPGEDRVCQVIFYQVMTPVAEEIARGLGTYTRQPTPFPPREGRSNIRRGRA